MRTEVSADFWPPGVERGARLVVERATEAWRQEQPRQFGRFTPGNATYENLYEWLQKCPYPNDLAVYVLQNGRPSRRSTLRNLLRFGPGGIAHLLCSHTLVYEVEYKYRVLNGRKVYAIIFTK